MAILGRHHHDGDAPHRPAPAVAGGEGRPGQARTPAGGPPDYYDPRTGQPVYVARGTGQAPSAVQPATAQPARAQADTYVPQTPHHDGDRPEQVWGERSRIVLLPTAAPSILGLFGFMGATVMVGAWFAGWYGTPVTPLILFPFAAVFGGVAQFAAGMFAYRARDGLATAVHGLWGSFWIAFGVMEFFVLVGLEPPIPLGAANPSFAWWFIVLAAITGMAAFAALAQNLGTFCVLGLLAVGSGFAAAGFYGGWSLSITIAGYLFVASAAAAWYTASALMLTNAYGRVILPVGQLWGGAEKNLPGRVPGAPIQYAAGMPGAKIGQ